MNTFFPSLLLSGAALVAAGFSSHARPIPAAVQDPSAMNMPKITPCLWFADDAETALRFYASVFPGAKALDELRAGEGGMMPEGTLIAAELQIGGERIMLLNGNPARDFTEAMSLRVLCETQAEIDALWQKLTSGGGEPGRCGWLKDRFGVSWQIVPSALGDMLRDEDPARAGRVGEAMMSMDKLDLGRLRKAYEGR